MATAATIFGMEMKVEFLRLARAKSFSLATIGFPVMSYLLFGIVNSHDQGGEQVSRLRSGYPVCDGERSSRLSPKERPAAELGEVARELGLSEGTVRNYLSEAMSKLGAVNRIDAARMARAKGWL